MFRFRFYLSGPKYTFSHLNVLVIIEAQVASYCGDSSVDAYGPEELELGVNVKKKGLSRRSQVIVNSFVIGLC